jgi:hypothetical protein
MFKVTDPSSIAESRCLKFSARSCNVTLRRGLATNVAEEMQ